MSKHKVDESVDMEKYKNRKVVVVDESDTEIGEEFLIQAHRGDGVLHRAFSLVVYRKNGKGPELLLQKRSRRKPIFPGYWSNTCCYNMAPYEEYESRVVSRVREEMGMDIGEAQIEELYGFVYHAKDKDGWCEREYDKVFIAEWSGSVEPNPDEAEDYRWVGWSDLLDEIEEKPEEFAPWTKMIMDDNRIEEIFS